MLGMAKRLEDEHRPEELEIGDILLISRTKG